MSNFLSKQTISTQGRSSTTKSTFADTLGSSSSLPQATDNNETRPPDSRKKNGIDTNILNYKSLDSRSGILKYRSLDLLGKTQPEDSADSMPQDGQPTSGPMAGQFFRRGLSFSEREWISRSRAAELSALYELSDTKDPTLNRDADISQSLNAQTPSFGTRLLTLKQAKNAESQQTRNCLSEIEPSSVRSLKATNGPKEEQDSNDSESLPPPRKGSFDQIRNKLGFPRRQALGSSLVDKTSAQNIEACHDNENRIPNCVQYTGKSSQTNLPEKPLVEEAKPQRDSYSMGNLMDARTIVLPDLC